MDKFIKRFMDNFNSITDYYNYLVDLTKKYEYVGITNEWLIDNYYLLVEHKNIIMLDKKENSKKLYKNENVYYLIHDIVSKYNYNINTHNLVKELNKYQKETKNYLSYNEFDVIPLVLLFIYTEKLNKLCEIEYSRLLDKKKVEKALENAEEKDNVNISEFLDINSNINNRTNYIFEVNRCLKEFGAKSNEAFRELNLLLEKQNISIREILNDEYQRRIDTNITISNIFNNLKDFYENFGVEELLKGANNCEKMLLRDKLYTKMTPETKALYRKKIIKDSRHKHISEVDYIEDLFRKASSDNYHIGSLLFKNKKTTPRVIMYIGCILLLSYI